MWIGRVVPGEAIWYNTGSFLDRQPRGPSESERGVGICVIDPPLSKMPSCANWIGQWLQFFVFVQFLVAGKITTLTPPNFCKVTDGHRLRYNSQA